MHRKTRVRPKTNFCRGQRPLLSQALVKLGNRMRLQPSCPVHTAARGHSVVHGQRPIFPVPLQQPTPYRYLILLLKLWLISNLGPLVSAVLPWAKKLPSHEIHSVLPWMLPAFPMKFRMNSWIWGTILARNLFYEQLLTRFWCAMHQSYPNVIMASSFMLLR